MIDLLDGHLIEAPRFKPMARFYKFGCQRVFYKGDAPEQKETEQERALAEVANEKWSRFKEVGAKAQDDYMGKVKDMGTEASSKFARGAAASATAAEFSKAPLLTRPGLSLASPAVKSSMLGLALDRAKSSGENTMGAALSREDQHAGGVQSVVAMGEGESAAAQSGISDVAGMAAQKAGLDAVEKFNSRAAKMSAAGTLVGAGLQGLGEPYLKKKAWHRKTNAEYGFGDSLGSSDPFA